MSRNFTLFPLFSNISYAVHPFKEIRCHVISIADKRHYMKMETCITLLWRWKFFFTTLPKAYCWWAGYASPQPRKEASRGHLS